MENGTNDQLKNSKPWLFKPGQSGNPSGRPKGSSFKDIFDKIGSKKVKDITDDLFLPKDLKKSVLKYDPEITIKEAIAYTTIFNALVNDKHARDFFADRSEGKAPETITIKEDHVIIDIEDDDDEDEE